VLLLGSGGGNGEGAVGIQTAGTEPVRTEGSPLILTVEGAVSGGDTGRDELPEIVVPLPFARGGIE